MDYILLSASIASMVLNNSIVSGFGKKMLHGKTDAYRFNSVTYLICLLLFAFLAFGNTFSWYTVLLAFVFGIVTMLSNFYKVLALADGPTHITILITTASMIIPTMSGVVMGLEQFRPLKLPVIAILIFFIYLSAKKDEAGKIGKNWVLFCGLSFIFQGIIGVIQKIHQSSDHKSELFPFLFVSFTVSFIFASFMGYSQKTDTRFTAKHYIFSAICGICVFTMNYLNLRLSGVLPSQLFFPTVNGTTIILTSIVAVFVFGEKLTKKQLIGLAGGLISLAAICII